MEDLLELAFRLIAGVLRAVAWLIDALFILDFFEQRSAAFYDSILRMSR